MKINSRNRIGQIFSLPTNIYYSEEKVPRYFDINKPTLLVISSSVLKIRSEIINNLPSNSIVYTHSGSSPTFSDIENQQLPTCISQIVGVGGGAVMDIAKAYLVLIMSKQNHSLEEILGNTEILVDYLGERNSLTLNLVPSLFGSSSELTPWSTIWDHKKSKKLSLSGDFLYANNAVYDISLPRSAYIEKVMISGLDCLSHSIESCWSKKGNFLSYAHAVEAIDLCISCLPLLKSQKTESRCFAQLARASILSGLSLSQAETSVAHSLSYPLTLFHNVPHGIATSIFLGELLEIAEEAKLEITSIVRHSLVRNGYHQAASSICLGFRAFLKDCGAFDQLESIDFGNINELNLADQASLYAKYRGAIFELKTEQAINLYSSLQSLVAAQGSSL